MRCFNALDCEAMMSKIDLTPFFMTLSGKKYLQVAGRVLLFRDVHPSGGIHTELITLDLDKGFAQYKAVVLDANGAILATAYGSETLKGFPTGWIEKAETVAVGRALAAAGFGTQFALADFHDHDHAKLADAPVAPSDAVTAEAIKKPTQAQIKRVFEAAKAGPGLDWLKARCAELLIPAASAEWSMVDYQRLVTELSTAVQI
jgi:hypothetical protein